MPRRVGPADVRAPSPASREEETTTQKDTRHTGAFKRPLIAALLTIGMIVPSAGLAMTASAAEGAAPSAAAAAAQTTAQSGAAASAATQSQNTSKPQSTSSSAPAAPAAAPTAKTSAPAAPVAKAASPAPVQSAPAPAATQAPAMTHAPAAAQPTAVVPAQPTASAPTVDRYNLAEQDGTVVVVAPDAGNATIETNLNEFLGGYEFGQPVQSNGVWTIQATLGSNNLSNGWTMVMSKFSWLTPSVKATDFDKSWSGTNYTATFTYDENAKTWKLTTPVRLAVKTEAPKPKTFTLTFETNGGSAIAPQPVQEGGTYYPDEPTRDGYTFTGWYADKDLTQRFDLINFKIEQDTTVYAGWKKNEPEPATAFYHFYSDPDSEASDQSVLCTIGKPIADCYDFADLQGTKDGYVFAGWYDNKNLAGSPIDAQHTLAEKGWAAFYAKWVKADETFTLTFETNGGSAIAPQQVKAGEGYDGDAATTRDGYTFTGWYTDKDLTTTVDLKELKLFADTTVYAGWKKNETKPQPGDQTKPASKPTAQKPAAKKTTTAKGTAAKKTTTVKKSTKNLSRTGSSVSAIAIAALALAAAGIVLARKRAE
ncbi:InlB B-repeat-containing protein [Bifidobacterium parmae]|uniref:Internalin n=1 Tax=Bifidobacterium parmae TaxID=361854 RepID=A0A2N5J4H1_9BIFI|nr:InlB B-repeat-containing protein [Bifidobacterium parmae]PLS29112.1 internalin [Bifidobacterium parmae]